MQWIATSGFLVASIYFSPVILATAVAHVFDDGNITPYYASLKVIMSPALK